uniref:Uncharacterized protein n=1 Tax=Sinocyclocheilus grahami TaxID=75366 RepID=A0A672RW76_SINGR
MFLCFLQMKANSSPDAGCAGRLPRLPPLPASQKPSDLYEVCIHLYNSQYPPLLQNHSRTLAVPYKELRHHRSPSESIGNNYSPRGQNLKIQHLQRRHHSLQYHSDSPVVWKRQPIFSACITPVIHKSRPLSPNQQLEIMRREETQSQREQTEPTERDLERYVYYITEGVYGHMLTPQPPEQITAILKLLPSRFQGDERKMQKMPEDLLEEVQRDYEFNLRKSIVDYILLDPAERERLSVSAVPRPFPSRVIRAPVPWSESYREAHSWQTENLCTVNPMMLHVQDLWMSSFTSLRFVRLDDLLSADLPLLPAEFEELVRRQCQNTRDELLNTWLPRCASLFVTFKDSWLPLVPKKASISPVKAQKLFYSVAALMSLQLRSLVVASLLDLLQFFQLHQDGNDFGEYFDELKYTQRPLLLVKLRLEDPKIAFEPSLESCWELIQHAFTQIIDSAHNIPRVHAHMLKDDLPMNSVVIVYICHRYDEITDRITSKLSTTEELVELNQYLRHTSEVTVHKLRHEIEEAVKRLDFLLDYATLPGTNILCVMCACKYCVYGNTILLKYTTNTNISNILIMWFSVTVPQSRFGAVWDLWEHFFFKTPLKSFSLHRGGYEVVQHFDPLA